MESNKEIISGYQLMLVMYLLHVKSRKFIVSFLNVVYQNAKYRFLPNSFLGKKNVISIACIGFVEINKIFPTPIAAQE